MSDDEEYAKLILVTDPQCAKHPIAMEVKTGRHGVIGSTPFSRGIINRPTRLQRAAQGLATQELYSEGGIYLGQRPTREVEWDRIARVMTKIARGLHYNKIGNLAPPVESYAVRVAGPTNFEEWLIRERLAEQQAQELAEKAFQYTAINGNGDWSESAWLLTFYEGFEFLVYVKAMVEHMRRN